MAARPAVRLERLGLSSRFKDGRGGPSSGWCGILVAIPRSRSLSPTKVWREVTAGVGSFYSN